MKERFLMRISFIGSVIGLVAIYMIVSHMDFSGVKIGSITGDMTGTTVNVTGNVEDLYRHKDGHIFFTLSDETGGVKIVIWSDTAKRLNFTIKNNIDVNVMGNVKLYKGEPEVIARTVKLYN
jgi:DNA/RNA endonuclease YhcR with UshA esterase domain